MDLKPALLALSLAAILTGCGRGDAPATRIAPTQIPDLPPECSRVIDHAPLVEGQSFKHTLARERAQLDAARAILSACGVFYSDLKTNLARGVGFQP